MLLGLVVAEDDVEPVTPRVLPQPHRLSRRILPVVIEVDDVARHGRDASR